MKAAAFLISAAVVAHAGASAAQDAQATSAFTVDPNTPARTTRQMLESVAPVIAIYAVDPTASDCRGEDCGPIVRFFVLNRSLGGARTTSVGCSAFDAGNARIAQNSTTTEVPSSQAIVGQVLFRGADFSRFGKVVCSIGK